MAPTKQQNFLKKGTIFFGQLYYLDDRIEQNEMEGLAEGMDEK